MASVSNVLADGTKVSDLTGKVVRPEEAREAYELISEINGKEDKEE